jgi:hypothetical protein
MNFNFLHFSTDLIFWTLTLAALLVLLVVLLGRDRARRFPWFTAAIAIMALRMVVSHLLLRRLPMIPANAVYLTLIDLAEIVSLLVVVELARRAFIGAKRLAWIVATLILLAVAGTVLALWGPWPAFKTLFTAGAMPALRLMQLFAQKTELLVSLLLVQLGLLVFVFGRRFGAGWRSHTWQLVLGFFTASVAQLSLRGAWQYIATHPPIRTQSDYLRVMAMQQKFINTESAVLLVVLLWWIVCLWIEEPGAKAAAAPVAAGEAALPEAPAAAVNAEKQGES